ncbi:hypothetical protein [Vibrio nitrifigilis]|uniref:Aldose 1-epimerase n=1 Tax=Vibrio nitrifigilis TaxID=2789781 RepID=A0ABS0GHS6_9VIBR|nr:hypothetical protein [Vibrio nitrifigilis]MBF9001983.1 hypothetical protein [Vibrio nitrifigilis]
MQTELKSRSASRVVVDANDDLLLVKECLVGPLAINLWREPHDEFQVAWEYYCAPGTLLLEPLDGSSNSCLWKADRHDLFAPTALHDQRGVETSIEQTLNLSVVHYFQ